MTLAGRIANRLPAHDHYVEPFAGSLSVLLAKPPSHMETINDLDQDVMLFWRVLRDFPERLIAVAELTPHARSEYEASYELDGCDDIERARRVWVRLSQSRTGTLRKTGWRFYENPGGTHVGMPEYINAYVERMPPAAKRLKHVSLECRDALDVIRDYGDHAGVCLYVDPPYDGSVRSVGYRCEMQDEEDHRNLSEALHACRASVVLSGYSSPLYKELYDDWESETFTAYTGQGGPDGSRTEVLWSNRPMGESRLFYV